MKKIFLLLLLISLGVLLLFFVQRGQEQSCERWILSHKESSHAKASAKGMVPFDIGLIDFIKKIDFPATEPKGDNIKHGYVAQDSFFKGMNELDLLWHGSIYSIQYIGTSVYHVVRLFPFPEDDKEILTIGKFINYEIHEDLFALSDEKFNKNGLATFEDTPKEMTLSDFVVYGYVVILNNSIKTSYWENDKFGVFLKRTEKGLQASYMTTTTCYKLRVSFTINQQEK